ncbi:MAG: metallophosphoesterase family protein [Saprospiraceae bacterium]|nr:metallophosphoesterase family protein [Saprospiraceae bacterium]
MKILIISDTHGYLDKSIMKHISEADEVWHAGDVGNIELLDKIKKLKPLIAVYGNIDGSDIRTEYPENELFTRDGLKILMTHIAGYPSKYNSRAKKIILDNKPDLVVCGHSHILRIMRDKELNHIHINPGACGIYGFHAVRTIVKFEINSSKIENVAIIELGKRSAIPQPSENT